MHDFQHYKELHLDVLYTLFHILTPYIKVLYLFYNIFYIDVIKYICVRFMYMVYYTWVLLNIL